MAQLQYLPTEILIQILQYVRQDDFRAFLFSQATSRMFRSIIQDMMMSVNNKFSVSSSASASASASLGGTQPAQGRRRRRPCFHPLLEPRFAPLFNTADAFTAQERAKNKYYYLSLEGDYTLPFRRLPWAQSEDEREVYLRPEASWRHLPLLAEDGQGGSGHITHLEIVKNYTTQISDTVEYFQVELLPPFPSSSSPSSSSSSAAETKAATTTTGGLTMGMFYDLLLSEQGTYGWETGSWELLLGTRLRSVDLLYEYECYVFNDPELVDEDAPPHCAVLHVLGGSGCDQVFAGMDWETCWRPQVLGQKPPRCLPWQGPRNLTVEDSEEDE